MSSRPVAFSNQETAKFRSYESSLCGGKILKTRSIPLRPVPGRLGGRSTVLSSDVSRIEYTDDPGYTNLSNYAWYSDNCGGTTRPVGQNLPEPVGTL